VALPTWKKISHAIEPAINQLPRSWRRSVDQFETMLDRTSNETIKQMPAGWVYQNLRRVHAYWDRHLLSPYDTTRKRVIPPLPAARSDMLGPNEVSTGNSVGGGLRPYNFLAQIVLPQVDHGLWKRLATTQTRWDLLAIMCKLQEHKAIHGEYPKSLEILTDIPHDYVTGRPPHYKH